MFGEASAAQICFELFQLLQNCHRVSCYREGNLHCRRNCGRTYARLEAAPMGGGYGLDMQRVPERHQGGFLDGFALGRVGVNGVRDIFQACAHFNGQTEP